MLKLHQALFHRLPRSSKPVANAYERTVLRHENVFKFRATVTRDQKWNGARSKQAACKGTPNLGPR
eukprot:12431373-Karenia_brevis.AAC.1